jgi:hypothetical protein
VSDAARIADKYVARDGGPPRSQLREGDHASLQPASDATHSAVLILSSFVGAHTADASFGGYTTRQAFAALTRLTGLPAGILRRIATGELDRTPRLERK